MPGRSSSAVSAQGHHHVHRDVPETTIALVLLTAAAIALCGGDTLKIVLRAVAFVLVHSMCDVRVHVVALVWWMPTPYVRDVVARRGAFITAVVAACGWLPCICSDVDSSTTAAPLTQLSLPLTQPPIFSVAPPPKTHSASSGIHPDIRMPHAKAFACHMFQLTILPGPRQDREREGSTMARAGFVDNSRMGASKPVKSGAEPIKISSLNMAENTANIAANARKPSTRRHHRSNKRAAPRNYVSYIRCWHPPHQSHNVNKDIAHRVHQYE
eukprot:6767533-Pyramimonas_sp.AAC.1